MAVGKYYDRQRRRPLDMDNDGCSLDDWNQQAGMAPFARHPDGFPVFLPLETLEESDEYKDSDPYTVELDGVSQFHRRRLDCTLALIEEAAGQAHGVSKLLDLGCGQGHITARIKERFPDAEVSALDHSLSAIQYAVGRFPGIDFAVGDAYESPYADGYFDIVVCNNLWEHVPDPLRLLATIRRILKPGGCLILSTPSRYRLDSLLRVARGKPVNLMSEHHVTEYSVGQVLEQLAHGGFTVIRVSSKSLREERLKSRLAKRLLSSLISLSGSHNQLEATVFYLAQRV